MWWFEGGVFQQRQTCVFQGSAEVSEMVWSNDHSGRTQSFRDQVTRGRPLHKTIGGFRCGQAKNQQSFCPYRRPVRTEQQEPCCG